MADIDDDPSGAPPAAAPAGSDADALDNLLAEFEAMRGDGQTPQSPQSDTPHDAGQQPPPAPQQPPPHASPNIEQRLDELQTQIQLDAARRDYNAAMAAVRGDADSRVFNDRFMHTWIDNEARTDLRLAQAWINRKADPRSYRDAVEKLGRRFHKEVVSTAPDRHATEDRELVTAAVRGASGRVPEGRPPDYSRMTDAQFAAEKDKLFGR
jgi:hypothetical protein